MFQIASASQTSQTWRTIIGSDAFLDNLPIGIYGCDRDGVIRQFNRRAAQLWGRFPTIGDTDRRFCGSHRLFRSDGRPLPHDESPVVDVLRSGSAIHDQTVIIERPDGTRITALVNVQPLVNAEGNLTGAVTCLQDISDLAQVSDRSQLRDDDAKVPEQRAPDGEQRLRDVLEALSVAVYTTDAKGKITFYNQAAVELSGRRPQLGSDEWCVTWRLHQLDGTPLPHDQCPMAIALKEQRPVRGMQAIAERPDGSRIRFMPFPTPLFDKDGRLSGAVNMLVDVTEQHQAEVESAHLAAIVASSDDAIISKSLDGTVRSWNAAATRIFGYEAEEMIGQSITRIIPQELLGEEAQILAQLRRGERIEHFETVRVTKDGRLLNISLTVSPVRDKSGQVVGASKVARDITERKQAEELQQLLVGELSHRVKNTLATVQSIANQTVHRARTPTEFASSFSGRIQALAHTHDLLTHNSWHGADVLALVRDQLLLGGVDDHRISFSGPLVTLDPQPALHLGLVLHELGTNARKYGSLSVPNGSLSIKWMVRTNEGRTLCLQWLESGGPAVTAPSARGFGTTLVERSLASHGGEACVHYGAEGVTCELTLPLPERAQSHGGTFMMPSQAGWSPSASSRRAAPSGIRGKRILLVEDEPLIAMDVIQTLSDAGCVVVGPAATPEKAKKLINAADFDAALLDANLGGHSVDELAAALTRLNIPFAFLTGYGREGLPQAFRHILMINKPFARQDAFSVIGHLLEPSDTVVPLRQKGT